jgi:hypothetical protein
MLVKHKVENFKRWKTLFDDHSDSRKKAGLTDLYVLRDVNDPENVFVICEVKNLAKAQDFINSKGLQDVLKKSGVVDMPAVYFLKK